MSRSSIFYALWCIGVIALMMTATVNGFSPFASGGARGGSFFFFSSHRAYGPNHK
jgi:hypothetical protein